MNIDNRIAELLALAEAEGFTLGLPPERIIEAENAGYVVDLRTGDIIGRASDWFELTTHGEAVAHLLSDESAVEL